MRSCGDALKNLLGPFIFCSNHVFAMQSHEEPEFSLAAAANGQQFTLNFRLARQFSLDQQSEAQRSLAPLVL